MALRLLTATLPRQEIGTEEVIAIVEYHLHRNRVALASHIIRQRTLTQFARIL